jgi:type I restriction enzyme M protein
VHHHNGLLNVNGIFERRFHVIATNPPFGAVVQEGNVVLRSDYTVPPEARSRYKSEYGQAYDDAVARVESAEGKPILSLFTLPRSKSIKTELLFIERCLDLLAPGGRLGIVLPEGIFNNPSLAHVREFTEDRAFLRAMVSLPQETFTSSGASVKCSVLFLEKFTDKDAERFAQTRADALAEITAKHQPEVDATHSRIEKAMAEAKEAKDRESLATLRKELADFDKRIAETIAKESRALLKQRFDYPIFLYEAEKVGISATGEPDLNELYPNDRVPPGIEKTCLELYREFREDPAPFFVEGPAA